MYFRHTNRPGFWFGLIDFCTAGVFFLFYMPLDGLQNELDYILGRRTQRYWVAYLLGIPTLFIYPLVWMARIADELKAKAMELGINYPLVEELPFSPDKSFFQSFNALMYLPARTRTSLHSSPSNLS